QRLRAVPRRRRAARVHPREGDHPQAVHARPEPEAVSAPGGGLRRGSQGAEAALRTEAALMRVADYVVVGAGSAGCIVARRLADTGASVILLEAGRRDNTQLVRKPGMIGPLHSV